MLFYERTGRNMLPVSGHFLRLLAIELSLLGVAMIVTITGCDATCAVREATPDQSCKSRLVVLGKAIVEYRAEHGELPQTLTGPKGDRHSWRALVAPTRLAWTDHGKMDYRLDEPWDSARNREAVSKFAQHTLGYTCPLENRKDDYRFVSYVMLVRPAKEQNAERAVETALPDAAVLIVESANCGIEYFEPKDLDWDSLWIGDSPFGPGKLNALHPTVVRAIRVDGKVIDIPKEIGKDELKKLLNGGEQR
jgi:hypothetical protein